MDEKKCELLGLYRSDATFETKDYRTVFFKSTMDKHDSDIPYGFISIEDEKHRLKKEARLKALLEYVDESDL